MVNHWEKARESHTETPFLTHWDDYVKHDSFATSCGAFGIFIHEMQELSVVHSLWQFPQWLTNLLQNEEISRYLYKRTEACSSQR